jgi:hypothetical protein
VTTRVKQRSAAIAGLNGRADLEKARVITQPYQSAHISNREIDGTGQIARKRITQCYDFIASADWPAPERDGLRIG